MCRTQGTEICVRIHAQEMETHGRRKNIQRMHATSRGYDTAMAMHGLLHLEARRSFCRKIQAPAVYILPRLSNTKLCGKCGQHKAKAGFAPAAWLRTRSGSRICLSCTSRAHGFATSQKRQSKKVHACFPPLGRDSRKKGQLICEECQQPKLPLGTPAGAPRTTKYSSASMNALSQKS